MNNIQKLIEAVALGDKEQQAAAFASIMQEKTRSAIEVKTIETAGKIYNTQEAIEESIEEAIEEIIEGSEEVTISLDEALLTEKIRAGKGKTTVDADYMHDDFFTNTSQRKFKIKIKPTGKSTADITGEKKNILAFLQSDDYGMDDTDIKDLFPELMESLNESRVKIPADLEGMNDLLDKAKDIRLSGQDYDRILKSLPAKTLQTWIHDAAFKHKDFQPAYAVGYQAGMGRGFPKKGGLEGNNPFKKNTLAFHAWMTVGQDGFTNGQG